MNRIIRTVLASVGAVAVVSGGALGVAYATTPAPAQSADQGASSAELTKTVDDLVSQINKLEKDLNEPMPTLTTSTPTPEAQRQGVEDAPAATAAATREATEATASKTTEHRESDDRSDDSKDSDD